MVSDELPKFIIQEIDQSSQYLKTIIQLGDANSATLGFLPYGAFRRLADAGRILACITAEAGCIGYLLYDISGYKVKLTHLCVDKKWRGKGIAKELIKQLKAKTNYLYGILASCRRDYQMDGMWSSLGFVAVHERPGRSKEGTILTEWWLSYGHPDLLTTLAWRKTEARMCVAIDATIFYDLADDETTDEGSKESKALTADWLEPELEFCLTDEVKNEINRNKDSKQRKKLRETADKFVFLPYTQEAFDEVYQTIGDFFSEDIKDREVTHFRQLAQVISSSIKVPFFATRNQRLLEIEEEIYKKFALLIIHPVELILKLNELRREAEYQPVRLAGTNIEKKRIISGKQELVIELFACDDEKLEFRRKFYQFFLYPKRFDCFTIGRREENPMALIVYDREEKHELKVPIFRFKDNVVTSTIIRHCIFQSFSTAATEERPFTRITEPYLDEKVELALQEDSFLKTEKGWLKANLPIAET
ncbi:MAG: GNAT family N-acetyltransferase, partial [Scytonema sp. PMC 1069.18]|nr:GNAT family N-acetyltransferase [Scytonema sp. PMC 1069.18]